MALFVMKRFWGDDENAPNDNDPPDLSVTKKRKKTDVKKTSEVKRHSSPVNAYQSDRPSDDVTTQENRIKRHKNGLINDQETIGEDKQPKRSLKCKDEKLLSTPNNKKTKLKDTLKNKTEQVDCGRTINECGDEEMGHLSEMAEKHCITPRIKKEKLKKKSSLNNKLDEGDTKCNVESNNETANAVTSEVGYSVSGRKKTKRSKNKDGFKTRGDKGGDDVERVDGEADDLREKERMRGLTEERGGFMVLGRVQEKQKAKVQRRLPDWIRSPYIVSPDLLKDQQPLSSIPNLSPHLIASVHANKIRHFFPVQLQVIPAILTDSLHGVYMGRAGSRPGDVCCSAPTGSGKTLSFVIPIVQLLEKRVVPRIRCVVLLPVIELAKQVYNVFHTYSKPTDIKVALLSGQKSFEAEQSEIVKKTVDGYRSLVDIVVTTPGRLVDHIGLTPGFDLRHLRYLVIDEADRMVSELKQDWLPRLQEAVYSTNHPQSIGGVAFTRRQPGHMTPASNLKMDIPLQKLVFSATLSLNPEVLQQLHLFQPRLYTSIKHTQTTDPLAKGKKSLGSGETEETIGALVKPSGLKECYSVVKSDQKPLAVVHLIRNLGYSNILCFTASVQAAQRLCLVLRHVGGVKVMEMSSSKSAKARAAALERFSRGHVDMLVCTDTMARGMDLENVGCVVSYDVPHHQLTYVHRVGRTARAGREGTAITLVLPREVHHYKELLKQNGDTPTRLDLNADQLTQLAPAVERALHKTAVIVERKSRNLRVPSRARTAATRSRAGMKQSRADMAKSKKQKKFKRHLKQPSKT